MDKYEQELIKDVEKELQKYYSIRLKISTDLELAKNDTQHIIPFKLILKYENAKVITDIIIESLESWLENQELN